MGGLIAKLKEKLFNTKLEIVVLGLENSGKTTFLHQLTSGTYKKTVPTIGLNVSQVKKGNLSLKVWDLGGQVQYRGEWGAYTRDCDILVFMIDATNVRISHSNLTSIIFF
jgi:ADP-ribosylation factor-like protein 8